MTMNLNNPYRPAPELTPPRLVFSPLAWLKLLWFLHAGDTEIGGFGISQEEDPLSIGDFVTVRQAVTAASVEFDDTAVAEYYDRCVDQGLHPKQFGRIWIHTHPGSSPQPSGTDEQTFARVFGRCDWSMMFIMSRTGGIYARLNFSAGPGGSLLLAVGVDWSAWPQQALEQGDLLGAQVRAWVVEYQANIHDLLPGLAEQADLRVLEDWWEEKAFGGRDAAGALHADERLAWGRGEVRR
jgi:hypothetical protein